MSTFNCDQESAYQKINKFFVEQISQLETPIIDARPNCVTVGPYRIITNGAQYEVWRSRSYLFDFTKRGWAVGYTLCLYRGDHSTARKLIDLNKQFTKLNEEQDLYNYHIECSRKKNDFDRELTMRNRLSRVASEIATVEYQAETILKSLHL
jgi:hypothetical protein